jgi:phage shock protein C
MAKTLFLSEDKKISGVCGGLAEYLDIDAGIVRVLWVLITVSTGILPGVIAYIVAAMVIPKASESVKKE